MSETERWIDCPLCGDLVPTMHECRPRPEQDGIDVVDLNVKTHRRAKQADIYERALQEIRWECAHPCIALANHIGNIVWKALQRAEKLR